MPHDQVSSIQVWVETPADCYRKNRRAIYTESHLSKIQFTTDLDRTATCIDDGTNWYTGGASVTTQDFNVPN